MYCEFIWSVWFMFIFSILERLQRTGNNARPSFHVQVKQILKKCNFSSSNVSFLFVFIVLV